MEVILTTNQFEKVCEEVAFDHGKLYQDIDYNFARDLIETAMALAGVSVIIIDDTEEEE
jgi:hypothetical protein